MTLLLALALHRLLLGQLLHLQLGLLPRLRGLLRGKLLAVHLRHVRERAKALVPVNK